MALTRVDEPDEVGTLAARVAALESALAASSQPSSTTSLASISVFAIPALALLGFVGIGFDHISEQDLRVLHTVAEYGLGIERE